ILLLLLPADLPAALNRLLLSNCTITTLVKGEEAPFRGFIVVDAEGRIATIGRGEPAADVDASLVFDAGGKVAMPGFISGHSHLAGSVTRGLASDQWVTDWSRAISWLQASGQLAPGDLYHFALHGAL